MDQAVFAGVGNVYRAELLFRHRIHPLRPGRTLRVGQFRAMWDDLVELMAEAGFPAGTVNLTSTDLELTEDGHDADLASLIHRAIDGGKPYNQIDADNGLPARAFLLRFIYRMSDQDLRDLAAENGWRVVRRLGGQQIEFYNDASTRTIA